jgi:hypothetical protein
MSAETSSAWPLVHPHDDGIRPAGPPDACFYCGQRIGQRHAADCVVVTKLIAMHVTARLPSGNVFFGTWTFTVPQCWEAHDCDAAYGKGTWCCSNLLHRREEVAWSDDMVWSELEALYESGDCLCNGTLTFNFLHVVDATPRRELRMPTEKVN